MESIWCIECCVWMYLYITQHDRLQVSLSFPKRILSSSFTLKIEKFRWKFPRCCEIWALFGILKYTFLCFTTHFDDFFYFSSTFFTFFFIFKFCLFALHKNSNLFSKITRQSLRITRNSAISLRKMSTSRLNLYLWSAQLCVNGDFFFLCSFYKWM